MREPQQKWEEICNEKGVYYDICQSFCYLSQ